MQSPIEKFLSAPRPGVTPPAPAWSDPCVADAHICRELAISHDTLARMRQRGAWPPPCLRLGPAGRGPGRTRLSVFRRARRLLQAGQPWTPHADPSAEP